MSLSDDPVEESPVASPEVWSPRRWLALSVLFAAGFMDLLDTTIVNVAIPSIRSGLDADYADLQWILAGYLLAVAVGLIAGGRLGDVLGRRRVFLCGVAAFGAFSLCSGLAPDPTFLVIARILQGLAAAMMIPQILSTIQVSFPRDEQRRALAMYSAVAGVAVMSGPLLAGLLLTGFGLSWRWIFLINVPVSVLVTIATVLVVPESRGRETRRLDLAGVALVSCALFALVFALIEGRALDWPGWVLALLAAAVALFVAFVWVERRIERGGGSPLVSMWLFEQRAFAAGIGVVLVLFSGLVGFFLSFTIFLQLGLGYTPLQSALSTFPSSVGLVVASLVATKLAPNAGRAALAVGALVMAAAMTVLILVVDHYGGELSPWAIRPVILVFGLGMGLILPPIADVIIAGVRERDVGAASGVINTAMQVGGAAGVVITGLILFSAIGGHAERSASKVVPQTSRELASAGVAAAASQRAVEGFQACFVDKARVEDPVAVPASCRREAARLEATADPRSARPLSAAAVRAREDNFTASIQRVLWYEVAVFGLTSTLLWLLPNAAARVTARKDAVPVPG